MIDGDAQTLVAVQKIANSFKTLSKDQLDFVMPELKKIIGLIQNKIHFKIVTADIDFNEQTLVASLEEPSQAHLRPTITRLQMQMKTS